MIYDNKKTLKSSQKMMKKKGQKKNFENIILTLQKQRMTYEKHRRGSKAHDRWFHQT